jgi:hypothetical protein
MGGGLHKTMSRRIEIINEKILDSLKKKDDYSKQMQGLVAEGERIQKEGDELLQKISRVDEKVRPEIMREIKKIEIGEFEDISRVYLGLEKKDEGKVFIEIADRLYEFKEGFKKAKEDSKNGKDNLRDTKQKITNTGDNA